MAEKIRKFEFGGYGGNPGKYPWDEWLDGSIWKLKAGEDYTCATSSIRNLARQTADARGMKLKTRTVDDDLYIQAVKP